MVCVKTNLLSKDPRPLRMKGLLIEGNDKEEVEEDKNDNENQKDEGEADETASDVVDIRSDDTKGQCRVMRKM